MICTGPSEMLFLFGAWGCVALIAIVAAYIIGAGRGAYLAGKATEVHGLSPKHFPRSWRP